MNKYLAGLIVSCCISGGLQAQTFDSYIDQILASNPDLLSARAAAASELYEARSENALDDPEIELSRQWAKGDSENKFEISVSQSFDWPGVYAARSKALKSQSRAMDYLNLSKELDARLEAKTLLLDIIYNKKQIKCLSEQFEAINRLVEKYTTGVERGELSRMDLMKLKIERIRISNSLDDAKLQSAVLKQSLSALAGGNSCDDIIAAMNEYPEEVILSVDDYDRILTEADPQGKYNALMAQSQRDIVKAESRKRLPSLSLGYIHSREDGDIFNGMSVGVSLPFFSAKNKVKAARALETSMQYEQQTIALQRKATMESNRIKTVDLFRRMNEMQSVFKNSDATSMLVKALEGGQISVLEYLNEVQYYLEARSELLTLEYEYQVAAANLNKYNILR